MHSALLLSCCLLLLACTEALDQMKTCTTDIFWEHNIQNRPAVLPPYSINGGNAARGGQVNLFIDQSNSRGALPCADGEERKAKGVTNCTTTTKKTPPPRSSSHRCLTSLV